MLQDTMHSNEGKSTPEYTCFLQNSKNELFIFKYSETSDNCCFVPTVRCWEVLQNGFVEIW